MLKTLAHVTFGFLTGGLWFVWLGVKVALKFLRNV